MNDQPLSSKYPFISAVFNRVFNTTELDPVFEKLVKLKKDSTGIVSIVHIGDSHVQPDFIGSVLRSGLQDFFGNAGRGVVFPYQLALSNAPADIKSNSPIKWEYNRLAHPEISIEFGVSGFGIRTEISPAYLNFSLNNISTGPVAFNRLKFFLDTINSWEVDTPFDSVGTPLIRKDSLTYRELILSRPISSFTLTSNSPGLKAFYGVSLENSSPGVLLHTIGVNGARYDQFNTASLFWQQLPSLKADLYIVSLGTNEAQRAALSEVGFTRELDLFIQQLHRSSPNASILISTAPDSYKGRESNKILKQLNELLASYCNKNHIAFWDLYRITNGYGSAYSWAKRGLMSRDRVHFTAEGYQLQGALLLNALSKAYNAYRSARISR